MLRSVDNSKDNTERNSVCGPLKVKRRGGGDGGARSDRLDVTMVSSGKWRFRCAGIADTCCIRSLK